MVVWAVCALGTRDIRSLRLSKRRTLSQHANEKELPRDVCKPLDSARPSTWVGTQWDYYNLQDTRHSKNRSKLRRICIYI